MPAAALTGRPQAVSSISSFIANTFNRGENVDNKSGRYY